MKTLEYNMGSVSGIGIVDTGSVITGFVIIVGGRVMEKVVSVRRPVSGIGIVDTTGSVITGFVIVVGGRVVEKVVSGRRPVSGIGIIDTTGSVIT